LKFSQINVSTNYSSIYYIVSPLVRWCSDVLSHVRVQPHIATVFKEKPCPHGKHIPAHKPDHERGEKTRPNRCKARVYLRRIPCNQPTPIASKKASLEATNQGQFAFDKALNLHANPAGEMHEKTPDLGDRVAISQGILIVCLVHPVLMRLSACTSVTRISSFADALACVLVLRFLFLADGNKVDGDVDGEADDTGGADNADGADRADGADGADRADGADGADGADEADDVDGVDDAD